MVLLLVLSGASAGDWDCEGTVITYMNHDDSPLGGITGLWFDGQKYFGDILSKETAACFGRGRYVGIFVPKKGTTLQIGGR